MKNLNFTTIGKSGRTGSLNSVGSKDFRPIPEAAGGGTHCGIYGFYDSNEIVADDGAVGTKPYLLV